MTQIFGTVLLFATEEGTIHGKIPWQNSDWVRGVPFFCKTEQRRMWNKRGVWEFNLRSWPQVHFHTENIDKSKYGSLGFMKWSP